LVVFSLAVSTAIDAAIGPYKGKQTGENSLFRTLHSSLGAGDVVLADRCFSGWFDVALLAGVASTWSSASTSSGRTTFALASDLERMTT
jgi:hypothetical protein